MVLAQDNAGGHTVAAPWAAFGFGGPPPTSSRIRSSCSRLSSGNSASRRARPRGPGTNGTGISRFITSHPFPGCQKPSPPATRHRLLHGPSATTLPQSGRRALCVSRPSCGIVGLPRGPPVVSRAASRLVPQPTRCVHLRPLYRLWDRRSQRSWAFSRRLAPFGRPTRHGTASSSGTRPRTPRPRPAMTPPS